MASNCRHFPDADDHCLVCEQDELAEEKVECFRCGEVVARIETENSVCNWCLEADHHRTESYR